MATIVVTGGAGFIGSNVLAGLEARGGARLVCCDRFGDGEKWRNVAKRDLADVVAPERLLEWLARHEDEVDAIVHLGAVSDTTARDVDATLDANFRSSLALWEWCAVRAKRLLWASSAATYGDGAAGFDDDPSVAALARLRPLNPYGWSKHLFDRRVAADLAARGRAPRQHVGLKFFNVYGPNEYHKDAQRSVIHRVHAVARSGHACTLFRSHRADIPDGGQQRDFVWVGDCVDIVLWLLDHPRVNGLFNVGSGRARSFRDAAQAVYAACGREPRIEFVDTPPELRAHYQYFTEAKLDRLRAAGWTKPATGLEDGVRRYVTEFLAAADPYR